MTEVVIVDAIRTPIGALGGSLAAVRPDDMAALVIKEIIQRNKFDPALVEEVFLGCANQAGEDNRNVARMAALLAGLPMEVGGVTVNRLCASGLNAINQAARAIKAGEGEVYIAGGVESMSRAPYSLPKADSGYSFGNLTAYDTALGWRYPNPKMKELYGIDSMGETAENIAKERPHITREKQDAFALRSHQRAITAIDSGRFKAEILPVAIPQKKGDAIVVSQDEHPRETSLEALAKLKGVVRPDGTVTAGNASGVNDGACALLLADGVQAARYGLKPRARVVGMAVAGVAPRIMGMGPAPATQKVLAQTGLTIDHMDVIELNEAFAAQGLAVLRALGIKDDDARVNAWGGAIALGHPLGASGARLVTTAVNRLHEHAGKYALCTMCIGVGQGIAVILERV